MIFLASIAAEARGVRRCGGGTNLPSGASAVRGGMVGEEGGDIVRGTPGLAVSGMGCSELVGEEGELVGFVAALTMCGGGAESLSGLSSIWRDKSAASDISSCVGEGESCRIICVG